MWWSYLLLHELQQLKATWRLCPCFLRSITVRTSQFSLVRTSQCLFYLDPYKSIRNCPCPKGKNYETRQKKGKGTQVVKVKSLVQGHQSQRQMEKYMADRQHLIQSSLFFLKMKLEMGRNLLTAILNCLCRIL